MNDFALQIEYKRQKEWSHVPMWAEMAVGGVGAGLFVVSYFMKFGLGLVIAFGLIMVGKGLVILLDLGHSDRFLNVFKRPGSSWVSKGAWGLILFAGLGGLTILPTIFTSLPWQPWAGFGKLLGLLATLFAIFLMIYDGFLLAKSRGIAFWGNGTMPMLFGSSAVAGGIGGYLLLLPLAGAGTTSPALVAVNLATLGVLGLNVYACITYGHGAKEGAQHSAQKLTKGELSQVFLGGTVLVGIIIPLVFTLSAFLGLPVPDFIWLLVGVTEILGVVFLRYSILKAGVYSPVVDL